jgi:hypothetical protein
MLIDTVLVIITLMLINLLAIFSCWPLLASLVASGLGGYTRDQNGTKCDHQRETHDASNMDEKR